MLNILQGNLLSYVEYVTSHLGNVSSHLGNVKSYV